MRNSNFIVRCLSAKGTLSVDKEDLFHCIKVGVLNDLFQGFGTQIVVKKLCNLQDRGLCVLWENDDRKWVGNQLPLMLPVT